MVILDITAVNTPWPNIAKALGISCTNISWTITSYSLIFGSLLLPRRPRPAALLGRRGCSVTGLAFFTVASLMSATAPARGPRLFSPPVQASLGARLLSLAPRRSRSSNHRVSVSSRDQGACAGARSAAAGSAIACSSASSLIGAVRLADEFFLVVNTAQSQFLRSRSRRSDRPRPHQRPIEVASTFAAPPWPNREHGTSVYAITPRPEPSRLTSAPQLKWSLWTSWPRLFATFERRAQATAPQELSDFFRDRAVSPPSG